MARTPLEHALEHVAGGRPIFPLHYPLPTGGCSCGRGQSCPNAGKHPAFEGWQTWATTDREQVQQFWRGRPRSNMGMPTGERSGVAVLDVDPRHGGEESLAELERRFGRLPGTVESLTGGGGRQIWFRFREGLRNSVGETNPLGPGLDIRGEGGLIVLPGSLHPSGRTYEWEASSHPNDVSLAPLPDWLFGLLTGEKSNGRREPAPPAPEKIRDGSRNNTLTSLAGTMRRRGPTAPEILPALLAINAARCEPPLAEGEVAEVATAVSRYAPEQARELRLIESRNARIVEDELGISPLYVSRGTPPIYTATVRATTLRLSSDQLMNFRLFKKRCMEELDFIPEPPIRYDQEGRRKPGGVAWEELVNEALAAVIPEAEVPEDASPEGALWEVIRDFLAGGRLSEDREALARGNVVIEAGRYLFRGKDLRKHLTLNSVTGWTEHGLWLVVRDHGGENTVYKIRGRPARVWSVPEETAALKIKKP